MGRRDVRAGKAVARTKAERERKSRLDARANDRANYEDDPDQARIKVKLSTEEIREAQDVRGLVARKVREECHARGLDTEAVAFVEEMPFSDGCIWSFQPLRRKLRGLS
jgi:hypothetical protein